MFLRGVQRYTTADRIIDQGVQDRVIVRKKVAERNICRISDNTKDHTQKWKEHRGRMSNKRLPKNTVKYKETAKRKVG